MIIRFERANVGAIASGMRSNNMLLGYGFRAGRLRG
jgi:hypothetical protein